MEKITMQLERRMLSAEDAEEMKIWVMGVPLYL